MRYEESQKRHAVKRAYQRYGIILSSEKYEKLLSLVKGGFASTVLIQSNNSSIKTIDFEGTKLFFVFDKRNQTIVTFLTFEIVKRYCGQTESKKQKQKGQVVLVKNKIGELIWWDETQKLSLVLINNAKVVFSYGEINFFPTKEEINSVLIKEATKQIDLVNKTVKTKYGLAIVLKELKERNVLRLKVIGTDKIVHLKPSAVTVLDSP